MNPLIVAYQAPLSMGFSRQEYWSVLPFPSPGDFTNPGIEPESSVLKADSLLLSHLYIYNNETIWNFKFQMLSFSHQSSHQSSILPSSTVLGSIIFINF